MTTKLKGRKVTIRRVRFFKAITYTGRPANVIDDAEDMMRYDGAFTNRVDPSVVAFITFHVGGQGLCFSFTPDRWRSFGIALVPILTPYGFEELHPANFQGWLTIRHPRDDDGRTDFECYEEITIEERMDDLGRRVL